MGGHTHDDGAAHRRGLPARLAAWRVAARVARRDARRARGRTALVVALVGLPVLVASTGAVLIVSSTPRDATYARLTLGDDPRVQARVTASVGEPVEQDLRGERWGTSGPPSDATPVTVAEQTAALAAVLPAGTEPVPVHRGWVRAATSERRMPHDVQGAVLTAQVGAGDPLAAVYRTEAGALPASAGEVAVGRSLATTLDVAVGDTLRVTWPGTDNPATATVTGVLAPSWNGTDLVAAPGTTPAPEETRSAWSSEQGLETTWFVVGDAPVTWESVLRLNALGSPATSRAVLLDPPPAADVPWGHEEPGGSVTALTAGVAALIVLEATLLIGPAFAVGARRSRRQLALLAASGAERSTLRHVLLLAGTTTGLIASVSGAVLGVGVAAAIGAVVAARSDVALFPDPRVPVLPLLGFVVVGTVAATAAAWLPARTAARVDVVAALAGRRVEAAPRHRAAALGVVVAVLGAATALTSAAAGRPTWSVVGVAAIVLGLVATSGSLVTLTGRLAPRLGAVGRIAVRDAARHRSRTGPAVAAVVAAVAGLGAAGIYQESQSERMLREYRPAAAPGTVAVRLAGPEVTDAVAALLGPTEDTLRDTLPVDQVVPVALAAPTGALGDGPAWTTVLAERPADQRCALWSGEQFTDAEVAALREDPRCGDGSAGANGVILWSDHEGTLSDVVVDDGRAVRALGYANSPAAARALEDGRAVVGDRFAIRPDGTARLVVTHAPLDGGAEEPGATVDVPATHVALPGMQYQVVLPPELLDDLGLEPVTVGLVATTTREPTDAEMASAGAALGSDVPLYVESEPSGGSLTQLVLAGAAAAVALGATAIAVALAAVESRPDLATLAAVGAEPRARRRFTATQAGIVAGLGTGVGTVAGLALGVVLVLARPSGSESAPVLAVPWPTTMLTVVGIPLLAVVVGWVAVRSDLPLTRRAAT